MSRREAVGRAPQPQEADLLATLVEGDEETVLEAAGVLDVQLGGEPDLGVDHAVRGEVLGRRIDVRYFPALWDVRNTLFPIWSQAFSVDKGRSWEWNSINVSEKIPPSDARASRP